MGGKWGNDKRCSVDGCDKKYKARGFCKVHYAKAMKNGDIKVKYSMGRPKHSMHSSPEYTAWSNMKARCNNPNNNNYKYYGAKGIRVCDRWNSSFEAFFEDMGHRKEGHSIDRINPLLGYSKNNCRWITWDYQNENKIKNKKYTYNGLTMTGFEWITFLAKKTNEYEGNEAPL